MSDILFQALHIIHISIIEQMEDQVKGKIGRTVYIHIHIHVGALEVKVIFGKGRQFIVVKTGDRYNGDIQNAQID